MQKPIFSCLLTSIIFLFLFENCSVKRIYTESTITEFQNWLKVEDPTFDKLTSQPFARAPLSKEQSFEVYKIIKELRDKDFIEKWEQQWEEKAFVLGDKTMKFEYKTFGQQPRTGRSLYISMHGGGGAPPEVNDQQWRNQIRLYEPEEGIYLAPRAPTDTWNLWHRAHIDEFFDLIIQAAVLFEGVSPNKVYLTGYSAGGDGVYQLAPRLSDRFAAAAMMAGHPNETIPDGLRNLPFALHMGAEDGAYKRNEKASDWKQLLKDLQEKDPEGYIHHVELHEGKGHWMDRQDTVAISWMRKHRRDPYPKKVVWQQDDVSHASFYWLGMPGHKEESRPQVVASVDGQKIFLEKNTAKGDLDFYINDSLFDMDKIVEIHQGDKVLFRGKVPRTIMAIWESVRVRGDIGYFYQGKVGLKLSSLN